MYKTLCDEISNKRQCEITIENFSTYTCINFVIMISSSSGEWGNECYVNTSIIYYKMSCFVRSFQFLFIS